MDPSTAAYNHAQMVFDRRRAAGSAGKGTRAASSRVPGKRALTDGLQRRPRFLRDLIDFQGPGALEVRITATKEFHDFLHPPLVWQWKDHVTPEQAFAACKLMLDDMRAGKAIDWQMEARRYLEQAAVAPEAPPAAPATAAALDGDA